MKVLLAYGQGHLTVDLPEAQTTVIEPRPVPGRLDERAAVLEALRHPVAARPLLDWIHPGDKICVVFTDATRATPNDRLIPWLLDYLRDVPREQITLLNATGTHRPGSRDEWERLLTPAVVNRYRVLNHDCRKGKDLVQLGTTRDGSAALINRHLVEADVRIVTGFIEPHFFAGFSGGPKGIMPGVAGLATILSNHGRRNIGDPAATFGVTAGNPLWEEICDIATRVGPSFLLNVTLNEQRQITGVFAGHLIEAHRHGADFVRRSAMQPVPAPFDIVLTTNSGYPLDLNLYQGVKGMSAGARILKPGGTLILACECREGTPAGSPYDRFLRSVSGPDEVLAKLASSTVTLPEQWQVHIQALIQKKARVWLYSSLRDHAVHAAHLVPCHDIGGTIAARLQELGPTARIAALPQGPLTIPFLEDSSQHSTPGSGRPGATRVFRSADIPVRLGVAPNKGADKNVRAPKARSCQGSKKGSSPPAGSIQENT
jgi:lactate racemase